MKYVLLFKKEELKGKKYFILEGISLCIEKNDIYVLMGNHKGEILSRVSNDNEDIIQGDVMSYEELMQYYDTDDFDVIMSELSSNVGSVFAFNENNELEICSESLYVYDKVTDKIKGQDDQIKNVISVIYGNQVLSSSHLSAEQKKVNKRNMVIMGKTGTGKTSIIKEIKENIDLPVCVTKLIGVDSTDNIFEIIFNFS